MSVERSPIDEALDQARDYGLIIETFELDGLKHRVDVEGAKPGKKTGEYLARVHRFPSGKEIVVGYYGDWRRPDDFRRFSTRSRKLTPEERREFAAEQAKLRVQQDAARADLARDAARRAKEIWAGLVDIAPCAYLDRKGVRAFGTKFARDGVLVVPVTNEAGLKVGLQFISPDGSKKFLTGTVKAGAFHLIGIVAQEMPLVLAEGYATAASIHMATGWPVVVCFDCGNLGLVSQVMRRMYPTVRLIIAGDDDHHRADNPGRAHATLAAKKVRAQAVFPRFEEPLDKSDFNDLHKAQSLEAVKEQLGQAFTPVVEAGIEQGKEQWQREIVYGDKGMVAMPQNVILILDNHPAWKGVFGFDQFAKRIVKLRETPYGGEAGPMTDPDEIMVAAWFGRHDTYKTWISTTTAREACCAVSYRYSFHPIRDYLTALKWDGEPRIDSFLSDFCNAPQNAVTAAFARCFFISAIARVFVPGIKADNMLVLEGEQGVRKSSLVRALCGEKYFADIGIAPSEKDFFQAIQGRWLIELSELASFGKADAAHIKRALSVQTDTFRPSYGRNTESFPRECIFVGTVNNSDWQRDETGGRRYMPVIVTDIDVDAVEAVRDQLWAEALHRFRKGEDWWVLPAEAKNEQEERYVEDIWAEAVVRWLNGKGAGAQYQDQLPVRVARTSVAAVLRHALDVEDKKQDRAMQTRVGNLMRRLGWKRITRWVSGVRIREYERPKDPPVAQPDSGVPEPC